MSIEQAAYNTVHESKMGVRGVAARTKLSYQTLLNKVCISNLTHHLTLVETADIMHATNDMRILDALATEFHGMFVPLPVLSTEMPRNLMSDIAKMSSEFGSLITEVADDVSDGIISENEWARIDIEASNLRAALAQLMVHLHRMHKAPMTKNAGNGNLNG